MSPRRAIPDKKKRSAIPTSLLIGAVVTVAVIAIIIAADFVIKSQDSAIPSTSSLAASGRTAGNTKAPISFVEYSDFQ